MENNVINVTIKNRKQVAFLEEKPVAFLVESTEDFLVAIFGRVEVATFSEGVLAVDIGFSLPVGRLFLFWLETFLHS